ncbi:hypothetical protein A2U01_0087857, partial [Trifolium medium]|nr:hypothetical protein [Trifolium medium]
MSETGVARRTRSKAGKGVTTVSTPVQKPQLDKSAKVSVKKVAPGPPRIKSKVIPNAPLDNVSFHLENGPA